MYIIILNGKYKNRCFKLKAGVNIIGRSSEANITISHDGAISKTHMKLSCSDKGNVTVEDLNSKNGTFVNDNQIQKSMVLKVGDVIHIGNTYMELSEYFMDGKVEQKEEIATRDMSMEALVFMEIVGVTVKIITGEDRVVLKHKNHLIKCFMMYLKERKPEFMKNIQNGFLIVFRNVESALGFACDFLKELTGKTDNYYKNAIMTGIHLQLGIHYGKTRKLPDGERTGTSVEKAMKLSLVTPEEKQRTILGGITKNLVPKIDRIFISEEVFGMVSGKTVYEMQFIGYFNLEGFEKPQKVYEVVI